MTDWPDPAIEILGAIATFETGLLHLQEFLDLSDRVISIMENGSQNVLCRAKAEEYRAAWATIEIAWALHLERQDTCISGANRAEILDGVAELKSVALRYCGRFAPTAAAARPVTTSEALLVLKLIGPDFPELETVRSQLDGCLVRELDGGTILEFDVQSRDRLISPGAVLGEGSLDDSDGVPIVITLLQNSGRIWQLDICRADSGRITTPIDPERVRTLGHRGGLVLG